MSDKITLKEAQERFNKKVKNVKYNCPKTKDKGKPGILLEKELGIKNGPECLDCLDGEIKSFEVLKKDNNYETKETISITMRGLKIDGARPTGNLIDKGVPWEDSYLKKKINNVLFVPYIRNNDTIEFICAINFNSSHKKFQQLKNDYDKIISYYETNGICQIQDRKDKNYKGTTIKGTTYIQGRTKGGGMKKSGKRTVGFYFMKDFVNYIILD
tara:strand:+ start:3640 stop:4281 length:642 start_codon:yes stop_codon:yes gene_type:complete